MDTAFPFPPCFESWTDYARWRETDCKEQLGAQHCTDCLPSFKVRMLAAGRCGHPETGFRITQEHGFTEHEMGIGIRGTWRDTPKVIRIAVAR